MMTLYLNWQDGETRRWYTVGRLSCEQGEYKFVYTKGAELAQETGRFMPFGRLNNLYESYTSKELFPLFSNRILSKSRQDYTEYLEWMDIKEESPNPLLILARSGGERATDNLQVYPAPETTPDNKYKAFFFIHGIRYLSRPNQELIENLLPDTQLFPMHDM